MKTGIPAFLAAAALAGLWTLPALAGDGEKDGASEKSGGEKAGKDCPTKGKADCDSGCKAECKEGARSDLDEVTLAIVDGTTEAGKKVLAAIPKDALEKVEAARKVALEKLAEIQKNVQELKADYDAACAEAKAKGAEVCCDMKATYEMDTKALHAKAKEQIALCAKAVRESISEEKLKDLSAECRKAGDMAKSLGERVKAAAAKLLEKKKKACKGDECGEDDDCDDCDDCEEDGEGVEEGGKGGDHCGKSGEKTEEKAGEKPNDKK